MKMRENKEDDENGQIEGAHDKISSKNKLIKSEVAALQSKKRVRGDPFMSAKKSDSKHMKLDATLNDRDLKDMTFIKKVQSNKKAEKSSLKLPAINNKGTT